MSSGGVVLKSRVVDKMGMLATYGIIIIARNRVGTIGVSRLRGQVCDHYNMPTPLSGTSPVPSSPGEPGGGFLMPQSGRGKGRIDLQGQRFGALTVVEYSGVWRNGAHWLCVCDCGNLRVVKSQKLRAGKTRSCGCLRPVAKKKAPRQLRFEFVRESAAAGGLYANYRCNAARRCGGIEFALTLEEFTAITKQPCYYCGIPPSRAYRNYVYSGVDRIDSTRGYVPGNVRPCCKTCNIAKGSMSEQDFYAWVRRISQHLQLQLVPGAAA